MFTNIERNQLRYNRIIQNDDISLYDSKFNIIDQTIRSIKIIKHLGIDKDRKHYYLGKCIYCNSEIILTYEQLHHNKRLCECEQKYKFRTIDHDIKQLYRKWYHMRDRCNNPHDRGYKNYGGRGIKVCPEWDNLETGFNNFYKWSIDNGWKPDLGLSLDRINSNGDYCPENCRWANYKIQSTNRTNLHYIWIKEYIFPLSIWSEIVGIKYMTIYNRLFAYNWPYDKAIFEDSKYTVDNFIVDSKYDIFNKYEEFVSNKLINPNIPRQFKVEEVKFPRGVVI